MSPDSPILSPKGQHGDLVAVLHEEGVLYRGLLGQGVNPPPGLILSHVGDVVPTPSIASLATVCDDTDKPSAALLLLLGWLPQLG